MLLSLCNSLVHVLSTIFGDHRSKHKLIESTKTTKSGITELPIDLCSGSLISTYSGSEFHHWIIQIQALIVEHYLQHECGRGRRIHLKFLNYYVSRLFKKLGRFQLMIRIVWSGQSYAWSQMGLMCCVCTPLLSDVSTCISLDKQHDLLFSYLVGFKRIDPRSRTNS